ncbi:MAG TPA: serine hydrolase domain-containing protein [Candidatus Dormibacteraeota bacterium]
MAQATPLAVEGTCDPRFDLVRQEFERNFADRGEVGASVAVTLDGKPVVELWGGAADPATGAPWTTDTVVVVWSSTKGATAICAHVLAARGELDLNAPVARYWPEFAANGKEQITVRMLLNHQAGLAALRQPLPPGAFYDWELMTSRLAAETPFWTPGFQRGYHGLTFGWLVGEVVRRVSGKSLGRFFKDEVASPLGLDFTIGNLPQADEARVAPIIPQPPPDPANLSPMEQAAFADPEGVTFLMIANTGGYMNPGECDTRAAHVAEIPAAGGVTNGRGLAKLYAPLANGGGGLVPESYVARMGSVDSAGWDAVLLLPTRWSLGFTKAVDNRHLAPESSVIVSEAAFGHPGMGGSLGFADPEARMSFGYAMNKQGTGAGLNERVQSLVDATYKSLGYREGGAGFYVR